MLERLSLERAAVPAHQSALAVLGVLSAAEFDLHKLFEAILDDTFRAVPGATAAILEVSRNGAMFRRERIMEAERFGPPLPARLVVPIVRAGQARGYLEVRTSAPLSFHPDDENIAQLLAVLTAAGLERMEAEEAERRFAATFWSAPVGIAHVALDGRFIRVNDQFCRITGSTRPDLLTEGFQRITHPDDLASDLAHVSQLLRGDSDRYLMEKRYIRADGEVVWVNLTVALIRNSAGEPDFFVSVIEDASELRRAHAEAMHDPLTGLLNRRGLLRDGQREVERAGRSGEPLAVAYVDLDNFKRINTDWGHAGGDDCLVATARALERAVGPGNLVARIGGDEFVLITSGPDANQLVARFRAALGDIYSAKGGPVLASVGLAIGAASPTKNVQHWIDAADQAMFRAKAAGKNRSEIISFG